MGVFYRTRGKRMVDIAAASIGLIVTAPLQVAVAVTIRVAMGPPIFFRQERPGLGGRPFVLLKFRTMAPFFDASEHSLPDEERVTRLGRWLRATSLDELPELWNILRGDMSFVGPRPLLMQYLPLYSVDEFRRHEVRPGLTGLAQVAGRNETTWPERLGIDVYYVDSMSFASDCKMLLKTVGLVASRRGISNPSLGPFTGSPQVTVWEGGGTDGQSDQSAI